MRTYLNYLTVLYLALFLIGDANAVPLTPQREPKENSFYVCYETSRIHHSVKAPLSTFRKYQYLGCTIIRTPCNAICLKKEKCPPVPLKLFGWFDTYPHALNAFYRCAYR
ncbi:MAG: hypothetical protein Q8R24_02885 [Legionellaceae bacterium]|nr:hypothetical protein [Legionellaceae bacterium]